MVNSENYKSSNNSSNNPKRPRKRTKMNGFEGGITSNINEVKNQPLQTLEMETWLENI